MVDGSYVDGTADSELERSALMFAMNLTMAGIDGDIYNEVVVQQTIDDQFQSYLEEDSIALDKLPTEKDKIRYLLKKYKELRASLSDLEIKYLKARKFTTAVMESETQSEAELDASLISNQQLHTMCKAFESKIRFMNKDCEKHQEEISRLTNEQDGLKTELANEQKKNEALNKETSDLKSEVSRLKAALEQSKKSNNNKSTVTSGTTQPSASSSTSVSIPDSEKALIDGHPLLKDTIESFDIHSDALQQQMSALRNEYPELLKGRLKSFYEQYEAREKYFLQHSRVNRLRLYVMKGKYDKEVRLRETYAKRLEVLSEQVETSSKSEVKLRAEIEELKGATNKLTEELESLQEWAEKTTDQLDKTTEQLEKDGFSNQQDEERIGTVLTEMSEVVEEITLQNSELFTRCEELELQLQMMKDAQTPEAMVAQKRASTESFKKLSLALVEERDQLEFSLARLEGDLARLNIQRDFELKQKEELAQKLAASERKLKELKAKKQPTEQVAAQKPTKAAPAVNGKKKDVTPAKERKLPDGQVELPNTPELVSKTPPSSNGSATQAPVQRIFDNIAPTKHNDKTQGMDYRNLPDAEVAQHLIDRFDRQVDPVEYFKTVFGFDITGVPPHEMLRRFSEENPCECGDKECPVHSQDATFRNGWATLLSEFQASLARKGQADPASANSRTQKSPSSPTPPPSSSQAKSKAPGTSSPTPPTQAQSQPATPDSATNTINGKKVFGPERPPTMVQYW